MDVHAGSASMCQAVVMKVKACGTRRTVQFLLAASIHTNTLINCHQVNNSSPRPVILQA
jgi:hypothetical protein